MLHLGAFWRFRNLLHFLSKRNHAWSISILFFRTKCLLEKCPRHMDSWCYGNFCYRYRNCCRIYFRSILFPKTFSRANSFKMGFKNSFKIFLSTFPFTISAGFLEGFITRYSIDMPNWLSSFIILFTLGVISFYYLVCPFIVHKKTQQLSAKLN